MEEIPGVNCQGKARAELMKNLRSALKEALDFNREDARAAAKSDYEEAAILVKRRELIRHLTTQINRSAAVSETRACHGLLAKSELSMSMAKASQ